MKKPAISYSGKVHPEQTLLINRKDNTYTMSCTGIRFIDKETKMIIMYIPAMDISGYGETDEEARQILEFSATQFLEYLLHLKEKEMNKELARMGWNHNVLSSKNYSKAFVDINGNLGGHVPDDTEIEYIEMAVSA